MSKRIFSTISIIFILFNTACQSDKKYPVNDRIEIPLTKEIGNPNIFDEIVTEVHFNSHYYKRPEYYNHRLKSIKGIPDLDTSLVAHKYADFWRFKYNLDEAGLLNDSIYTNLDKKKINADSLGYHIKLDNEFTILTGIVNNKQLVIADENKNNDFKDDKVFEFPLGFTSDSMKYSEYFSRLPKVDYNYECFENGEVIKYERKIVIYPDSSHPRVRFRKNQPLNVTLHVMGKFIDYWQGEIKLDDKKYTFHCQGRNRNYLHILIKSDSEKFATDDFAKNKDYEYLLKDTVQLANSSFVIDSFDYAKSKLILRKLAVNSKFGYRTGQTLKDLQLEDLNGKQFKISDFSTTKKYTLLDFWGTWCPPCLNTTPVLQNLYKKHAADLEIIGMAYDGSLEKVKAYTTEKNLEWPQAFIKNRTAPNSETNTLRIQYYPTFILLDQDHKIIKRTVGEEGIQEIEKFLLEQKDE